MTNSDALVFSDNYLTGLVGDVKAGYLTAQTLRDKLHLCTAVHQPEVVVHKKVRQDGFRIQANGLEQNGDRHLAAAVYTEVKKVFGVKFKVQPRAAVRNDAGRKQQLAGTVGFTFVVFKEHAGGTVQLRHDHTLGTVDDERTFFGHQRHFTHVDLLLFDFLNHFVGRSGRLTVVNNQLHTGAHCGAKGQSTGLTFAHIKARLGQVVFEKLHLDIAIVRNDGKCSFKSGLQTLLGPLVFRNICLQKRGVGVFLHLQQIGNFEDAVAASETFTNALAFCVRIGHEFSGQ